MSEEQVKIKVTSDKPKDPKKVEAGKRLGALSKELRERKMRERIQAEDNNYKMYVLTVVSVVVAIIGVVFTIKSYWFQTCPNPPNPKEVAQPTPPKKPSRPSNLITLDE